MSYLFSFISLILIHTSLILKILSPSPTKGLGRSSCIYYGSIDVKCGLAAVPVDNLPTECSSFIFDGLIADSNYTLSFSHDPGDTSYVKNLLASCKPVFLFYGHSNGEEWNYVLSGNVSIVKDFAQCEMDNLKAFLNVFDGISGLILNNLNCYYELGDVNTYTENLIAYLDTMISTFPDLAVGLNVPGTPFIDRCSMSQYCVDFNKLDRYIDFYVISVINFNDCTEELKCGVSPITGEQGRYTMEMLTILPRVISQKTKIHFSYRGSPINNEFDLCTTTYTTLCTNPPVNLTCADTQQSYVEKGKFANENGAGFIVENIDLIDPDSCCQCDRPFPAFYFLLGGFKCMATGKPCPMFDGNCDILSH